MLSKPPASHPEIPPSRRGFGLTLLTHIRNPSQLARLLYLTPSAAPHVFLSGANAESIAEDLGVELADPSYFFSEARWKEHRRGLGLPDTPYPPGSPHSDGKDEEALDMYPTGTVGAVALDIRGCICAVTSTGGRTNKLVGRIGDTPSMASGFWAEEWETKSWLRKTWNKITGKGDKMAVGISGTGDGDVWKQLLSRTSNIFSLSVLYSSSYCIYDRSPRPIVRRTHCDCCTGSCRRLTPRWWRRRCHRSG